MLKQVLAGCVIGAVATTGSYVRAEPTEAAAARVDESDVAAFRRLRAEAVAAANAGDLSLAADRLRQAETRVPNHPGLIVLRARTAAAQGHAAEALAQLTRYARAGLVMNLERDAVLSPLSQTPGFAEAAAQIEANRAPQGADRLSIVATIAGAGLIESLARDEARQSWFVSRVADRDVVTLHEDGRVSDFLSKAAPVEGVLGLSHDAKRGMLWAVSSPVPPATHGRSEPGPAALLAIDPATGAVRTTYPVAADGREHGPGDLVLDAQGAVYVADGLAGRIYRLPSGGAALEVFLPEGSLGSPQGMAITPDGEALIAADYSSGLWRAPLNGARPVRMAAPSAAVMIGIDGLISDGRALYALQNGVAPQRVLKLTPSADWTRIDRVEVLVANLPLIDQPTTGLLHDGHLVFVSRSQWSDFAPDGALRTAKPQPAIIARLRLD
ncbi:MULTISPECIES: SMP-30/gluconolactonase/LRE family protein [unclassified Brevundimonas]|uniref:SMP-30/gluconolactonase/LRE family protein n=1 Tax=unclassified Brevundimonas TaxID=2622653 RepID=UPI000CFD12C5|nr:MULTISPECIES: hypothetical protein [unclassified Brevundimonas]PRA29116.1 hypothetical protein CQ024_09075 [Brevundimonas sp. MYb27]PQZ84836.1 hypothetical protein CQ026_00925 [Brevundimonas sp. MYb31]PRB14572.1 hypothetical protein CQ039_09385 [Brevundimonas sp. MYb52]PRB36655.1 hypothetical protein CQ035_05570 [Brevundimonas sp. MYb46]PRB55646.1 hypothetical protein CQ028_01900 [Brevundimonas sp. MYb33]